MQQLRHKVTNDNQVGYEVTNDKQVRHGLTKKMPNGKVNAEIDANLKRVYSDALNETVPDRLKQLLEELRQKEPRQ